MSSENPFKKSTAGQPADLSLVAHVCGDAFSSGVGSATEAGRAMPIEGYQFARTVTHLDQYIERNLTTEGYNEAEQAAFRSFQVMIRNLRQNEEALRSVNSDASLKLTAKQFGDQIRALKKDEMMSMPGGWSAPDGGHQMIYQFERVEVDGVLCLKLHVHNAGAGINYHEQKTELVPGESEVTRELYYPTQTHLIKPPIDDSALNVYVADLMKAQLLARRSENEQEFDEKTLYEKYLNGVYTLSPDVKLIKDSDKALHSFTAGQISGTCTERSIHQTMKEHFDRLNVPHLYGPFIYRYERDTIKEYMGLPVKLQEASEFELLEEYLTNLYAILAKLENINHEEELATLQQMEKELAERKKAIPKPIEPPPPVFSEPTVALTKPPLRNPLPPKVGETVVVAPESPAKTPLPALEGKDNLLPSLQKISERLDALKANGQFVEILDYIETILSQFKLPTSADDFFQQNPFYDALKTPEARKIFFNALKKLNDDYQSAYHSMAKTQALGRKFVTSALIAAITDHVQTQYPLDGEGHRFHEITNRTLGKILRENANNPYLATKNPVLDERLVHLKRLYPTYSSGRMRLFEYYCNIIKRAPKEVSDELLERYRAAPCKESKLRKLLDEEPTHQILYHLTENLEKLIADARPGSPLHTFVTSFAQEQASEVALRDVLAPHKEAQRGSTDRFRLMVGGSKEKPELEFQAFPLDYLECELNKDMMGSQYVMPDGSVQQLALQRDYGQYKRLENHTQMYPAVAASVNPYHMSLEEKNAYARRTITKKETGERAFFTQRTAVSEQVDKTISDFREDILKLLEPANQSYFEANLFEPGLLLQEVKDNPNFLDDFDDLIEEGLSKTVTPEGMLTKDSLFFIRMKVEVDRYLAHTHPSRLEAYQIQISNILTANEKNTSDIKQALHQYRCSIIDTRHKTSSAAPNQHLEEAIASILFMNAFPSPKTDASPAERIEQSMMKQSLGNYIEHAPQTEVALAVQKAMQVVGLGVCIGVPVKVGHFYNVEIEGTPRAKYQVDLKNGLIFNERNLALTPVPPSLLYHPVTKYLPKETFEPCFVSKEGVQSIDGLGLCYEMGAPEPGLRFIRERHGSSFRLQKRFVINGVSEWFELGDLNQDQKRIFELNTETIDSLPIPKIYQQRDCLVWCSCKDKGLLITRNHQPVLHSPGTSNSFFQLDDKAQANGFVLCDKKNFFHQKFGAFEDSDFIAVTKNDSSYQITLDRYKLTIEAIRDESGNWIYRLRDNPAWILEDDFLKHPVMPHASNLVFTNAQTKQKICYFPVQDWILVKVRRGDSAYYAKDQNIHLQAEQKVIEEYLKKNKGAQLLPWQYTGFDALIRFPLNKDNEPYAETPVDALYLCYLYLGSHSPEKAWKVLEDCRKRLGGLEGTPEEIKMLHLIVNKLNIKTPKYAACQLKALSLLTQAIPANRVIEIPKETFDLTTPDGICHQKEWEELSEFSKNINSSIESLYGDYQKLYRHTTSKFYLSKPEEMSLFHYYKFNLPEGEQKTYGALARDIERLDVLMLLEELNALDNQPKLSKREKEFRAEVIARLNEDTRIHQHQSDVELASIDTSIPPDYRMHLTMHGLDWYWDLSKARIDANPVEHLSFDIEDKEFVKHFPSYLKLLKGPDSDDRKILVDFLFRALKKHHAVAMEKQGNDFCFLCNILYRIAMKPESINIDKKSFNDIVEQAKRLPNPSISIYQKVNKFEDLLTTRAQLKSELTTSVTKFTPITAGASERIKDFNREHFLTDARLSAFATFLEDCKDYQKNAEIFGAPAPVPDHPTPSLLILTKEERGAGRQQYQALLDMKQLAKKMFGGDTSALEKVKEITNEYIENLKGETSLLLNELLTLANQAPADPRKRILHDMALRAHKKEPLDLQQLLSIYVTGNQEEYLKNTMLSKDDVNRLHTLISHYLALSVRLDALKRLQAKTNEISPSCEPSVLEDVAHELLTEDKVNYETEPQAAVLQYYDKVLLRPEQLNAIKRMSTISDEITEEKDIAPFKEMIQQIIMGGGKSSVILPMLARLKARGTNLIVIEVPAPLLEANYRDLSQTSARLFNQPTCRFLFERNSECGVRDLEALLFRLNDIKRRSGYVITNAESVQSLRLKYTEVLFNKPDKPEELLVWKKQVSLLKSMVLLFKKQGDSLIDEVHLAMLYKKKLNYTQGIKQPIDPHIIQHSVKLYQFFDKIKLEHYVGREHQVQGKTLLSLLRDNQLLTRDEQWKQVLNGLALSLVTNPDSPLIPLMKKIGQTHYNAEQKRDEINQEAGRALYRYLVNTKDTTIPDFLKNAVDPDVWKIICIYKGQISELLPNTLRRRCNEHYGKSQENPTSGIAIPYSGNNCPNEKSRFGDPMEVINFSIQTLLIQGFTEEQMLNVTQSFIASANQEISDDDEHQNLRVNDTEAGIKFKKLTQLTLEDAQNILKRNNPQEMKALFERLKMNTNLMAEVLTSQILPTIQVDTAILGSNSFDHTRGFRSVQGVTGTPSNSSTYDPRLGYDKSTSSATYGFLTELIQHKHPGCVLIELAARPKTVEEIQHLLKGKHGILKVNSELYFVDLTLKKLEQLTKTPEHAENFEALFKKCVEEPQVANVDDIKHIETLLGKPLEVHIRAVPSANVDALVQNLFQGKDAQECIRAIIDISAKFKNISEMEIAVSLAKYIQSHPEQFSIPKPLTHVLFFHNDVLSAIKCDDLSYKAIGSCNLAVINQTLGNTPDSRFSFYDQRHTTGTDLKQAIKAKAMVMVDHETTLESCLQGVSRLRGLKDFQTLEFVVPPNLQNTSYEKLILLMDNNSALQLQLSNFSASLGKLKAVIKEDLDERMESMDDPIEANRLLVAADSVYLEASLMDMKKRFGNISSEMQVSQYFDEQAKNLIRQWTEILENVSITPDNTDEIRRKMDNIIKDALPICPEKVTSNIAPQGQEAENEEEQEQEQEQETEVEQEQMQQQEQEIDEASRTPAVQQPWRCTVERNYAVRGSYSEPEFKSLQELVSQIPPPPPAPQFGNIYASSNFYKVHGGKSRFIDGYLKQLHGLLWRRKPDGRLDCVMLSQEELEGLKKYPMPEGCWIGTTAHHVRAGKSPFAYELCMMVPGAALEKNKLYFEKVDQDIFYTIIKPSGETVRNKLNTPIEPFSLKQLKATKALILEEAAKNGHLEDDSEYKKIMEQVRYMSGSLKALLKTKERPWLSENAEEKLAFFEQHLLPIRETATKQDLALLKQTLTQRRKGLRYIDAHPFQDYKDFQWQKVIPELTDEDVELCQQVGNIYNQVPQEFLWYIKTVFQNANDNDFNARRNRMGKEGGRVDPWVDFKVDLSLKDSDLIESRPALKEMFEKHLQKRIQPVAELFLPFLQGTFIDADIQCWWARSMMYTLLPGLLPDLANRIKNNPKSALLDLMLEKASQDPDNYECQAMVRWLLAYKASNACRLFAIKPNAGFMFEDVESYLNKQDGIFLRGEKLYYVNYMEKTVREIIKTKMASDEDFNEVKQKCRDTITPTVTKDFTMEKLTPEALASNDPSTSSDLLMIEEILDHKLTDEGKMYPDKSHIRFCRLFEINEKETPSYDKVAGFMARRDAIVLHLDTLYYANVEKCTLEPLPLSRATPEQISLLKDKCRLSRQSVEMKIKPIDADEALLSKITQISGRAPSLEAKEGPQNFTVLERLLTVGGPNIAKMTEKLLEKMQKPIQINPKVWSSVSLDTMHRLFASHHQHAMKAFRKNNDFILTYIGMCKADKAALERVIQYCWTKNYKPHRRDTMFQIIKKYRDDEDIFQQIILKLPQSSKEAGSYLEKAYDKTLDVSLKPLVQAILFKPGVEPKAIDERFLKNKVLVADLLRNLDQTLRQYVIQEILKHPGDIEKPVLLSIIQWAPADFKETLAFRLLGREKNLQTFAHIVRTYGATLEKEHFQALIKVLPSHQKHPSEDNLNLLRELLRNDENPHYHQMSDALVSYMLHFSLKNTRLNKPAPIKALWREFLTHRTPDKYIHTLKADVLRDLYFKFKEAGDDELLGTLLQCEDKQKIIDKWIETADPALYHDLLTRFSTTLTDKQILRCVERFIDKPEDMSRLIPYFIKTTAFQAKEVRDPIIRRWTEMNSTKVVACMLENEVELQPELRNQMLYRILSSEVGAKKALNRISVHHLMPLFRDVLTHQSYDEAKPFWQGIFNHEIQHNSAFYKAIIRFEEVFREPLLSDFLKSSLFNKNKTPFIHQMLASDERKALISHGTYGYPLVLALLREPKISMSEELLKQFEHIQNKEVQEALLKRKPSLTQAEMKASLQTIKPDGAKQASTKDLRIEMRDLRERHEGAEERKEDLSKREPGS